jgi:hypothetical protein
VDVSLIRATTPVTDDGEVSGPGQEGLRKVHNNPHGLGAVTEFLTAMARNLLPAVTEKCSLRASWGRVILSCVGYLCTWSLLVIARD